MEKRVKRSVIPIYLIGVTWLVYALLFPLKAGMDYLICAVASVIAFLAGKALFPDKTYTTPGQQTEKAETKTETRKEQKPKSTGNPDIDALIQERERAISEMRRLNDAIEDAKISEQIDHLESVTGKIIDHVVAHPKKLPQIRRFMDYYLPTTLKLLNAYDRMDSVGVAGENITATKQRVARMMDTLVAAYDKQLDNLFGAEAIDISTDITVMEQLLKQEGFGSITASAQKHGEDDIKLEL